MHLRSVVAIALVVCACKQKEAPAPAATAPATAEVGSGAGSAPAPAYDPWAGPPAAADTSIGAKTGAQLSQIDPWAGRPPEKLEDKVDVAKIEKPVADKVELETLGDAAATGFTVAYNPSRHQNHEAYRSLLQTSKVFDEVAEGLNRTVRLPKAVAINTVSCDTINAFYDPLNKRIIVCYELLDYFVSIFKAEAKSDAELGNAVMGATMFGFFHEVGHGLIDLLDLPAVGREEDSADQLATLILIAGGEGGVAQALAGAYWFQLQSKGEHKTPFWDEHAFDQQRFYNILCLIFGSDPAKYNDFISKGQLPIERARRCPDEYAKIKKAWERLLQPHLTNGAALNMSYKPSVPLAEAPKTTQQDPWGEAAPPAAPPPPARGTTTITCEQVAAKASELIRAEAEGRAAKMSAAEQAELEIKLETELPAAIEQILAECAKADWSDASRRCVLDAPTLDVASKCQ